MPNIPVGATVLQQFPWSGDVASVLRMPSGTSRILFPPAAGVDLGPAGEPYIERVDGMAAGTLFLVRVAGPGCARGYRLFRVNGSKVAGWILQVCQQDRSEDRDLEVITVGAGSWEAIQRNRHDRKVREKIIDWHAADPDHLSYRERFLPVATSTSSTMAARTVGPAAAAAHTAAAHSTHASQAGADRSPLPAKVSTGAVAQSQPVEVNLDGPIGH
jgi:hypothetical protein